MLPDVFFQKKCIVDNFIILSKFLRSTLLLDRRRQKQIVFIVFPSFDTGNYGGVQTGELKEEGLQVIKGHYTEKFKHNPPGSPLIDVIRNVGYIADEKGYQPFIINYTIDDHRSDTEPHYDVPFENWRRVSKEYKAHYKPQEQFSNIQLPNTTNKPLLLKDDSGNYSFG